MQEGVGSRVMVAVRESHQYGDFKVHENVDFDVHENEFLCVCGPSGCGKTTLLEIMSGLQRPTSGHVLVRGEPANPKKHNISLVFQEPSTMPWLTVEQNIQVGLKVKKKPRDEMRRVVDDIISVVGLQDFRHYYPHQISGGMKQRVMIAMALVCKPRLLIADEPTTALDVTIQAQILELLAAVKRQNDMAVLLITHDLGIVAENADVVAIMYAGRIVEFADVYELFANPIHPYTRGLMACVPRLGAPHGRLTTIPGTVPSPASWPKGCRFEPRCALCTDDVRQRCRDHMPQLRQINDRHWAATFLAPGFDSAAATAPTLPFRRADQTPPGVPSTQGAL